MKSGGIKTSLFCLSSVIALAQPGTAERHAQNVWLEPCKQAGLSLPQLQINCCKLAMIAGVHARRSVRIQRKVAKLLQSSGFSMTDLQTLVNIIIHFPLGDFLVVSPWGAGLKEQMGWGLIMKL